MNDRAPRLAMVAVQAVLTVHLLIVLFHGYRIPLHWFTISDPGASGAIAIWMLGLLVSESWKRGTFSRLISQQWWTEKLRAHCWSLAILAILAIAFCIRLPMALWGIRHYVEWDEPAIVDNVLRMMREPGFDPHFLGYPGGYYYVLLVPFVLYFVQAVSSGIGTSLNDIPLFRFYEVGRLVTLGFGLATIYVTYRAGIKYSGKWVGILAAGFLCVSPLAVEIHQEIRTDVPLMFFSILLLPVVLSILEEGRLANYIVAGTLIGAATSMKYNGCVLMLPFILAHALTPHRKEWVSRALLAGCGSAAVTFFILSPYSFLHLPDLLTAWGVSAGHNTNPHHWAATSNPAAGIFAVLTYNCLGLFLTPVWLIGFFMIARSYVAKNMVFLSFPVAYIVFFSKYVVLFARFFLPLVPFLAILTAVPLVSIVSKVQQWRPGWRKWAVALAASIAVIGSCQPSYRVVVGAYLRTLPSTLDCAQSWINQNISAGAVILKNGYTPWLDPSRYDVRSCDDFGVALQANPDYFRPGSVVVASELANFALLKKFRLLKTFPKIEGERLGASQWIYRIPRATVEKTP